MLPSLIECIRGIAFFGFISLASAQTAIYVDSQIPDASCTTYNPATRTCSGGTATAYRTIAAAAAVADPGATVVLRQGTYNEQLRPASSGTAESPITFRSHESEAVYVSASPAMNISDRSHLVIEGLRVENTTWLEARNSHYNILRKCVFRRNPNGGTTGNVRFIQANYNRILDNIIDDGNDNLLLIDSNFNLVQGNTITEARHSIFGIRCGDYNIIRSNYFSNSQQKIGEVYDCGSDTSAVPNSFDSTKHNLIEDNIFAQAQTYYSTSAGNGIQYAGQEGIVRRNVFYNCNVGIGMQIYGDEAQHNNDNRIYHNVFYENFGAGIAIRPGSARNQYINNILVGNQGCSSDCNAISPGQVSYRTPFSPTSVLRNNNIVYQQPGQAVMEIEFGSGMSIAAFSQTHPGILVNTIELPPQFVDGAGHDLRLQANSPMIDAGGFLTTATSSGSGNVVPVADATAFYDGFGIPWEIGDLVQLQGQPQPARVVRVDYINRTLSLDRSVTWTTGQGISLSFNGQAPDIGAFEQWTTTMRPTPPRGLHVLPAQ